jgi:hypothetical protein
MAVAVITQATVAKRIAVPATTLQELSFGPGLAEQLHIAGDAAIRLYFGAQTDGAAPVGTDYVPLGAGVYAPLPTTRGPVFVMGESTSTTITVAQLR